MHLGVKFFRQLCCSKMGAKLKFQRKLSKELTRICGTIIFSFAFLLINCLDKIIHFSFLRYHARHLFVLARRLPQKKCMYVSWYKAFTFRSERASRNKNGCWSFWKWTIPSKTSSIHKISVIVHRWPFNFTLSQMRHYWRDISLFREKHHDLKRYDPKSFDP